MFATTCSNDEKRKITVKATSAGGRPAKLDGPLRVSVQSGDGTFEQDPADPLSFTVISGDEVAVPDVLGSGETTYTLEADADTGEGTNLINETVVLTVTGAQAAGLGLTVGAPEPK